jgi:hypothetical protein
VRRAAACAALALLGCGTPAREHGEAAARGGERPRTDETVKPAYPALTGAPDPLVAALCRALHQRSEERRAECCGGRVGIVLTAECERALGGAVQAGALRLEPGEVARCAAAVDGALAGCDWVGAFPPPVPPECRGLTHGAVAEGGRCRSSLECRGDLHCDGSGPTSPGACRAPRPDGAACSLAVDPLAGFLKQDDLDRAQPECRGACEHHRCTAFHALGASCGASLQCGAGRRCAAGACVEGERAAAGDPCSGEDCAAGLRCLRGRCIAPGATGAACASDFDCRGGCLRDGSGPPRCGPRCTMR